MSPAHSIGPTFSIGLVFWSAVACGGSAFSGREAPEELANGGSSSGAGMHRAGANGAGEGAGAGGTSGGSRAAIEMGRGGRFTDDGSGSGGSSAAPGSGGIGGQVLLPPEGEGAGGQPEPTLPGECPSPIREEWKTSLGGPGNHWRAEFGDPRVNVESEQLVISFDDIVARSAPFEGGYYLTAEVAFDGYTVLTPYPYVSQGTLPSLRRSADGAGIDLGGTSYGRSVTWNPAVPAGFAGKVVSGTTRAQVTTYIQAKSKQLAVKVSAGAQVYRSGWMGGFTAADTNLGVFRYVGENNSAVALSAPHDAISVGTVLGCQQLSDAAVIAHYED